MGARVIDLDTRIAPFGDRVGDLPFLGRTFSRLREEEASDSGIDPGRLTFADHAFASAPLLRELGRARGGRPRALALPERSAASSLAPVASVRRERGLLIYDVFIDAPDGAALDTLRRESEPHVVDRVESTRRRELPRIGDPPHHLDVVSDGIFAAHVEHWVHVLWVAPMLVPRITARGAWKRKRFGRGRAPSFIAPGVEVHPSAHLEGAVIDEGAEIGASCSIRYSYVGAGSRISDFSKIAWSVVGEGTHTLADTTLYEMVSLGGGTLANLLLKDTVLGRDVFLTTGVIFWSDALEGTVQVRHRDQWIDSGRKCLGGCAGHGAVLGARTIVSPGRALPNQTTVVMRREEGVQRIVESEPGTPMCWYDATLMPASDVRAKLGLSDQPSPNPSRMREGDQEAV